MIHTVTFETMTGPVGRRLTIIRVRNSDGKFDRLDAHARRFRR